MPTETDLRDAMIEVILPVVAGYGVEDCIDPARDIADAVIALLARWDCGKEVE